MTSTKLAAIAWVASAPVCSLAQVVLPIQNGGFENGGPTDSPSAWTVADGYNSLWIGDSLIGGANPADAYEGTNFLSASWEHAGLGGAGSLIGGGANAGRIYQDIDLSPYSSLLGQGDRYLGVSYGYFLNDGNDFGSITYDFYDAADTHLGGYSVEVQASGSAWRIVENNAAAPAPSDAARLRVTLGAGLNEGAFGSARNVAFDAIGASLQPAPPVEPLRDRVNGNLIQFNNDGAWCWYQDERVTQDRTRGNYLISSITSSNSTRLAGGTVRTTSFDPATGQRLTRAMADIDEDDHNVGAMLVLPDGRYLTMYSNHGHQGLQDTLSRYRVTTNPHDAGSWEPERSFDWRTTPGWDQNPFASTGVSYHNLFYLPAEDRVINFSRGTHMAMGALEFDPETNTLAWLGQTQQSITTNYGQGYHKYASNSDDKVYFLATETHPYDVNTSIYSGYYSGGQMFRMDGTLMDADAFDSEDTDPAGTVAYTEDFTLVQRADPEGAGHNRLWTADLAYHPDGTLGGLYSAKYNDNDYDQRLIYAYWDGSDWRTNEVAKMGAFLQDGQEEYTGLGAVVPDQPGVIYVSTPINPITDEETEKYEIYRGVTTNGGADWAWAAITEDSSVDNLRPTAVSGEDGQTLVSWFRGTYTAIWDIDAAVVGVIDTPLERRTLTHYVDADAGNTTLADGSTLVTYPSGGADGLWRERAGAGNGGGVYASNESGGEDAPALKTTLTGLADGLYDVFAYFWSDNDEDWRLAAGLAEEELLDARKIGSQSAAVEEFVAIETVAESLNDLQLYRAYVGRATVTDGSAIEVFIDDWANAAASNRTWYDGLGYALVSEALAGDFNADGRVDAADYVVWRNNLGGDNSRLNGAGDEAGASYGVVDGADLALWKTRYGATVHAERAVPEPAALAGVAATLGWSLLTRGRRQ